MVITHQGSNARNKSLTRDLKMKYFLGLEISPSAEVLCNSITVKKFHSRMISIA